MQCSNNMKQLGLALHGYCETHGCFPPAGIGYGWCTNQTSADPSVHNSSGLIMLLPYLEQQGLYDLYDQRQCACTATGGSGALAGDPVTTSNNAKVVSTRVTAFICPSDSGEPYLDEAVDPPQYCIKPGSGLKGAKTNYDFSVNYQSYARCNYWTQICALGTSDQIARRRMFGENSNCLVVDVKDGLSNTIAMGETLYSVYNGRCPAWGYRAWVMVGVDVGYNKLHGINSWAFNGTYTPGVLGTFASVGSSHPGGAHVLFGDGSVHFLNENTDLSTLEALSGMADGQVVSAP